MNTVSHQGIREAILKRIRAGEWELGALIPGEAEFAEEYACSRTTVNRALRTLAEEGIVERKRKGGTRVRPMPIRKASLTIPVIREQVEATGRVYSTRILDRRELKAPAGVRERMALSSAARLLFLETLHEADARPFALERRWIDPQTVPQFEDANLDKLSANEWLVRNVPFTNGRVELFAEAADERLSASLGVQSGDPLFVMRRTTWMERKSLTTMDLYYNQDYRFGFSI